MARDVRPRPARHVPCAGCRAGRLLIPRGPVPGPLRARFTPPASSAENQRPAAAPPGATCGWAGWAADRSLGGGVDVAREGRDDALRHVLAHPAPRRTAPQCRVRPRSAQRLRCEASSSAMPDLGPLGRVRPSSATGPAQRASPVEPAQRAPGPESGPQPALARTGTTLCCSGPCTHQPARPQAYSPGRPGPRRIAGEPAHPLQRAERPARGGVGGGHLW
jgi:hypothetical protein